MPLVVEDVCDIPQMVDSEEDSHKWPVLRRMLR